MRRNEIISDIFGRLHYMDRRGSGIGRILSSYAEFSEAPQFFSTDTYFLVTLPNRSTSPLAQTTMNLSEHQSEEEIGQLAEPKHQLRTGKHQLAESKHQLSAQNAPDDADWELYCFRVVTLKERGQGLRKNTVKQLTELFARYRYQYTFNRRNIADAFSMAENTASVLIKKCIHRGIMKKIKKDEYCFVNIQEQNP